MVVRQVHLEILMELAKKIKRYVEAQDGKGRQSSRQQQGSEQSRPAVASELFNMFPLTRDGDLGHPKGMGHLASGISCSTLWMLGCGHHIHPVTSRSEFGRFSYGAERFWSFRPPLLHRCLVKAGPPHQTLKPVQEGDTSALQDLQPWRFQTLV